jgi:hypothetical protein
MNETTPTAPRLLELPNGEFIDPFTVQGVRVAVNRCGPYVAIDVTTSAKELIVSCDGLNATHAWARCFAGRVNEAVKQACPVTSGADYESKPRFWAEFPSRGDGRMIRVTFNTEKERDDWIAKRSAVFPGYDVTNSAV